MKTRQYTVAEWAEKFRTLTPGDLEKYRKLTTEELAQLQGMHESYLSEPFTRQLSEATRLRIKEGCRRFLQAWTLDTLVGCAKPRIRLRMVVKEGVHAGYQRLNRDNSIHSYTWF